MGDRTGLDFSLGIEIDLDLVWGPNRLGFSV